MKKIRAAVVGYGNIGHYALEALEAAKDFEIAGIVRRQGDKDKPLALSPYEVVDDIAKLKNVDVAILATPTRSCPEYAERIVALGINGTLQESWKSECNCCWLGPRFRLCCTRANGKFGTKRHILH